MKKLALIIFVFLSVEPMVAQTTYWQQKADYDMKVDFDSNKHRLKGAQTITYYNNSPDTLTTLYYYLFFNAFQPGSMMDVNSRLIEDPDRRVGDRISKLNELEIGYTRVNDFKIDGKPCEFEERETILVVKLAKPIKPGGKAKLSLNWEGQVPVQIRRSGRFNREGVHYTMTQWFPKICNYDYEGWHAHQYVGREFHGVFGDYNIDITIDSKYTLAGTGVVQNPDEVGKGYEKGSKKVKTKTDKLTWKFKAENVIDFAWAADPSYVHKTHQVPGGPLLRFFYFDKFEENWSGLPKHMEQVFLLMEKYFGKYPYPEYAFIMGGDGGMEYPMCTMIMGGGSLEGLYGVSTHEAIHSWFQGVIATNEALYPWFDEGFTSYAEDMVQDSIYNRNSLNAHKGAHVRYFQLVNSGKQEPLTTHADHYASNRVYGVSSYSKGQVFVDQLSYILGYEDFFKGMQAFWSQWSFKHPNPRDFINVMQRSSGMYLGWYLENWIGTTKTIDYGIKNVISNGNTTEITLEKVTEMPMPIDLVIRYADGSTETIYIPTNLQLKGKKEEMYKNFTELPAWPFTHPTYTFTLSKSVNEIEFMEIDPTQRMADVNRDNNIYPASSIGNFKVD